MKPKMLVLAKTVPLHDRASGDYRLFQILKLLTKRFSVDFLSTTHPLFDPKKGRTYYAVRDGVFFEDRFLFEEERYQKDLREIEVNPLNQVRPIPFTIRPHNEYDIRPFLKGKKYDVIWVEFFYLFDQYILDLHVHQPWAHLIVDSVDLHFLRTERQLRYMKSELKFRIDSKQRKLPLGASFRARTRHLKGQAEYVREYEIRAYERADTVIAVGARDQSVLQEILPNQRILNVPNLHKPVLPEQFVPPPREARSGTIFVGNFDHEPNVSSAIFLRHQVLPLLAEAHAPLRILGHNPTRLVRTMDQAGDLRERVKVLGFVPETHPYIGEAMVSLAPVLYGAGMNGKIGEALSLGTPVVTSEIGAEGMGLRHEVDCLIASSPEEYARCVERLFADGDLWHELQRNGFARIQSLQTDSGLALDLADQLLSGIDLPKIRKAQFQENAAGKELIAEPEIRLEDFAPASTDPGVQPKRKKTERSRKQDFSIILLTYNQWKYTEFCLKSLLFSLRCHPEFSVEVIVVDNNSQDETREELKRIRGIRTILNDSNLGYAGGNNVGLRAASGNDLILLNNDTVCPPDWLERLAFARSRIPLLGLLCPSTNTELLQAIPGARYGNLREFFEFNRDLKMHRGGEWDTIDKVSGLCMLIPRNTLEKVGFIDESYGIGYFEDDDYSLRVEDAGLRLAVARDVYLHHFGSVSFKGANLQREKILQGAMAQFAMKWGKRGLDHVSRVHHGTMIRAKTSQDPSA